MVKCREKNTTGSGNKCAKPERITALWENQGGWIVGREKPEQNL